MGRDELEEQVRRLRFEGDVADLVDHEQGVAAQAAQLVLQPPVVVRGREPVDPLGRRRELDPVPGPAGADRDPDGVQAFLGALHHAGAVGGVFITTSRFSPDATEFARSITPRVILIDGPRLGELVVAHRIGVQVRQTFTVAELDEDFFE